MSEENRFCFTCGGRLTETSHKTHSTSSMAIFEVEFECPRCGRKERDITFWECLYKGNKKMEEWIFTFGSNHELKGKCVRISGSKEEAREKMISKYGFHWAFQYSAEEWERMKKDEWYGQYLEEEIPFEG